MTRSRAMWMWGLAAAVWTAPVEGQQLGEGPSPTDATADAGARRLTVVGYGDAKARAAAAERVSDAAVRAPVALPLASNSGPDVLHVQILLDAARFGPGVLDARWSENTAFALRAFRTAQGLPDSDEIDDDVLARLGAAAGGRDPLARYTLTDADVRGPYRTMPRSIYAKAKLDCLCYQSLLELLGERFHTTSDVLRRLNPDVDFTRAAAGTAVTVPNVTRERLPAATARIVVDRSEGGLHGLDAGGRVLFWLPSTVGSRDEPSPRGLLRVESVERNPRYHFNPRVLGDVPDSQPDAELAPGPNSPVGVLWAQLSKDHVGIHGTADPELVGYAQSHGCVRLTNWDAGWIAGLLRPGLPVEFR